ncbi:MAG: M23 family metallopeptidase [Spirochaetota bacterium]
MKKLSILIFLLLLYSNLAAQQHVYLDNENIQEYKGKLGKWFLFESRNSMISLIKKFSCSIDDVYTLNKIGSHFIKNFYFIPYSSDYIKELEKKNIFRKSIISNDEEFIWPLEEVLETSSVLGFRYGKFHPGMDLPAFGGSPIVASMEGLVIESGYADGYGKAIIIAHRNNFTTKYAHNYMNFVKKGEFVKKGQIIGLVGSTGISTGNHIHFEIRCQDIPMDPLDFLPQKNDLHIIHALKNWK